MDTQTLLLVLVEIAVIIGLARVMGMLFARFKQPPVIGEICAGIMLGPSFLGMLSPESLTVLFPSSTLPYLFLLSQIGLIFYMFLVGLELNPKFLSGKLKIAAGISNVSIILPFSLGFILADFVLYRLNQPSPALFLPFALFVGSAMSITAFPVLARILTDKGLTQTALGSMALTCASIDDISAWCLLAIAIAVTRTDSITTAIPILFGVASYVIFMMTAGRRFAKQVLGNYVQSGSIQQGLLTFIYIAVILSAVITEWIGIDVIFGGFILGVIIPKNNNLSAELKNKTEDFVTTFLLPLFFAYSGLNTELGLLNTSFLWGVCLLVILAAVAGKFCGVYLSARFFGIASQEAKAMGWLMNTRGLTELVILNVGLKLNVISPVMFTLFVIMALATTMITSPLLDRIYPSRAIAT